jgi:hypothetical protein
MLLLSLVVRDLETFLLSFPTSSFLLLFDLESGQQLGLNVGQDSTCETTMSEDSSATDLQRSREKQFTLGDCDSSHEFVEFLVVANRELDVTRGDSMFLVVESGVSSELENLCDQVLADCSEVDCRGRTRQYAIDEAERGKRQTGSAGTDASGEATFLEVPLEARAVVQACQSRRVDRRAAWERRTEGTTGGRCGID